MKVCVDVDYREEEALAAGLFFRGWQDSSATNTIVERIAESAPTNQGYSIDGSYHVYSGSWSTLTSRLSLLSSMHTFGLMTERSLALGLTCLRRLGA